MVREWLHEVLPEDAADRCRGRLRVVATRLPAFKLSEIKHFTNKADLISALMASVHIPFFLDLRPATRHAGHWFIDGSLQDFIHSNNSHLLAGKADLVVDYFDDEALQYARLDFVKLRSAEEVRVLMQQGEAYGQRLHQAGRLGFLGPHQLPPHLLGAPLS